MFIKPFKVKNNVQIKGSDVKKLRARLVKQFRLLTDADTAVIFPSKSSYNLITITTHAEQQVVVYGVDKRPMIFEFEDRLYPTIYALWCTAKFIPHFCTHPNVSFCAYN